jgi:heat shock protein HtpX
MDWSRDRELGLRMALTLVLLGVVTVILIVPLYGALVALAWIVVPFSASVVIGFIGTGIIVGSIVVLEFRSETPAMHGHTTRVEKTGYPELHRTVERLAQQADLPVPTVHVADNPLPNAYTSGLSPQRATIVVTTGLLAELGEKERQAVLAHELAHVKNRDAAVMTIASVPLVIAQTIHEWADDRWAQIANDASSENLSVLPLATCFAVAGALWLIGRLLVRLLSRYRELAADRGAIALTGSSAALASALETVDTQIGSTPDEDLRSMNGPSEAFAVVPVETDTVSEPVRLGPDGNRQSYLSKYTYPIKKRIAPLLTTHPTMKTRLEQLRNIEREL